MSDNQSAALKGSIEILDFGIGEYSEILSLQRTLFNRLTESKKHGRKIDREYILIGEHNPVMTIGRRGKEENLLLPENQIIKKGFSIYRIERGGDITCHIPGQIILYPILDLEKHKLGVKKYVDILEETIIRFLAKFDIVGLRREGATGVWIEGKDGEPDKKICAIGIKCSRFCTMHGLAFNLTADLSGFSLINPCGFTDKGVTSLKEQTLKNHNIKQAKRELLDIFLGLIFPL